MRLLAFATAGGTRPAPVLLLTAVLLGTVMPALAQSRRELKKAVQTLQSAARSQNMEAFLEAMPAVLEAKSTVAVRAVVEAFGTLVDTEKRLDVDDYYHFHSVVAKKLGDIKDGTLLKDLYKQQTRSKKWGARLIILEAAYYSAGRVDLKEKAFVALADREPRVVRRSLFYLRNSETLPVVDAILERYIEAEKKAKGIEWDRTLLAFQDALKRLLKVQLVSALDYQNYLSVRRNNADLFDPPQLQDDVTKLSLFGAEITGKNIAFVLDVSGSMMATDPIPIEIEDDRGTTVVGNPKKNAEIIRERRRITRARKELSRVVRNLPEDIRFNIIAYSTEVASWKQKLTAAATSAKKDAGKYIEGLEAEGITVTDYALEAAFFDISVDTIYLITDGAPTHRGSNSRERPPDADDLIEHIHDRVKKLNFLRGVRVFTLGFPEAEEEFLIKLAGDHSGKYTAIK